MKCFSPPEQLLSDQGRQFESQLMAEVCKLLGIQKSEKKTFHPQCDGLVERWNRTLLQSLAMSVTDHPENWEEFVKKICMAYNTSVHPILASHHSTLCLEDRSNCRWI